MRYDLRLFRILFQDRQQEPRQSHGHTRRIGETREASSETGSVVKTQGRHQEKPLKYRLRKLFTDEFDRAIKARMGRKSRLDYRSSGVFQCAGDSKPPAKGSCSTNSLTSSCRNDRASSSCPWGRKYPPRPRGLSRRRPAHQG